jgi:hypothetical protein
VAHGGTSSLELSNKGRGPYDFRELKPVVAVRELILAPLHKFPTFGLPNEHKSVGSSVGRAVGF